MVINPYLQTFQSIPSSQSSLSIQISSPQKKAHTYGQVTHNDRNGFDSRRPVPRPNHRGPGGETDEGALKKVELRADPAMSFVMPTEPRNVHPQPAPAESNAVSLLLALEQEKSLLGAELAAAEAESLALDREEQIFWHSYNSSSPSLYSVEQNSQALNAAYDYDMRELDRLLRTNVMDDKVSCREQSKYSVRHAR